MENPNEDINVNLKITSGDMEINFEVKNLDRNLITGFLNVLANSMIPRGQLKETIDEIKKKEESVAKGMGEVLNKER